MTDIAIHVENLSKMYRIGTKEEQPRSVEKFLDTPVKAPRSAQRDALGACGWPLPWPHTLVYNSELCASGFGMVSSGYEAGNAPA